MNIYIINHNELFTFILILRISNLIHKKKKIVLSSLIPVNNIYFCMRFLLYFCLYCNRYKEEYNVLKCSKP